MKDLTEYFERAHARKPLTQEEFKGVLAKIQEIDPTIEVLWEEDVEEWALLVKKDIGLLCMINTVVPMALVNEDYEYRDAVIAALDSFEVASNMRAEDYGTVSWLIDDERLKRTVPEIGWESISIEDKSDDDWWNTWDDEESDADDEVVRNSDGTHSVSLQFLWWATVI